MRPSSWRHDVEWTTIGPSEYHFSTSSTTSAGFAEVGRPTCSESACIGFIQNRAPSRKPTGRTSRVWATKFGDHGTEEIGGPIVSTSSAILPLAVRRLGPVLPAIPVTGLGPVRDGPPDRPDLGRGDLLLVLGASVRLDAGDDLRLRASCRPPTPAGDFHQHAKSLTRGWAAYDAAMAIAEDLEIAAFLKGQPKKLFIGGRWVEAASGKTFETINPATGEVLARVAEGGAEDIDRAVAAARSSFDRGTWRDLPPAERAKLLWQVGDMIEERATEFAQLETLDNGMPINDALLFHAPMAAATFRYSAGGGTKLAGATPQIWAPGKYLSYTLRQPVGVVGQIIPWNFPLMMAAWKIAPALACGNSVVLKPAEETPLSALLLAEVLQEAEIPQGVLNVVPGYGETAGARLASHPDVDKIAFTGSTAVGKLVARASAESNLKRVSLELGGKSPNIVFADAELTQAVSGAFFGVFWNQGQVCSAGSRLFVQEKVYDQTLDELVKTVEETRLGPGIDPLSQMGPLVSKAQMERVLGYIQTGNQEGARLLAGGKRPEGLDHGYFVQPTVFADVDGKMRIAQEEIFGPVVSAIPFRDEEDLIAKANDTVYGLAAGVWTKDVKRAHRVAHALNAGTVYVNCYHIADPVTPWGGFKQSGWGRELGPYALDLYTELKNVIVDIG